MDQRCGTRIPCDFRVLVMVHPAVFGPGVLLNVSISGALLQTPLVLSLLTQIELEVESPGMCRSSIMASITRRDAHQYGVAFRGANNKVIDRMLRAVQSQAEAVHVATPGEQVATAVNQPSYARSLLIEGTRRTQREAGSNGCELTATGDFLGTEPFSEQAPHSRYEC